MSSLRPASISNETAPAGGGMSLVKGCEHQIRCDPSCEGKHLQAPREKLRSEFARGRFPAPSRTVTFGLLAGYTG
jgi:hypothetical protein